MTIVILLGWKLSDWLVLTLSGMLTCTVVIGFADAVVVPVWVTKVDAVDEVDAVVAEADVVIDATVVDCEAAGVVELEVVETPTLAK